MTLLSVKSIQGKRDYMEDRYAYIKDHITVAMVCDGHGGYQVAAKTANELPGLLLNGLKTFQGSNLQNALKIRDIVRGWGDALIRARSGSTLTGIVAKDDTVYFYNVGDSRSCTVVDPNVNIYMLQPQFDDEGELSKRIYVDFTTTKFFCTVDHDHTQPSEVERVKKCGGSISSERLNGILSVTRALGDGDVGPGVCSVPDVYWVKRSAIRGPILMYSDGLYEPHRYNPKVNFKDDNLYNICLRRGCGDVVKYAYDNGSDDNITAMLVDIRH